MSITDELRKWGYGFCGDTHDVVTEIADRIDAEHQKALDEWKAKHGQMWLKGYAECHAELLEGNETLASDLEGCGWVRLPKDADGEYIHIGDVMENIVCPPVHREVTGVGVECFYGFDEGNGRYSQFGANCYRHYHAPTVEDVLREFAERWDEPMRYDRDEMVEQYAAKLKLADEDEEQ
jgi:hypothetical protein